MTGPDHIHARALPQPAQKKSPANVATGLLEIVLVPEIGIEPTTYALRMRRSTN
jgi:hypothetical protein